MKTFHIRVLDLKYQSTLEHLSFRYLTYKVRGRSEKEAVENARKLYMKGEKEIHSEEIPLLFKLFSIIS